MPKRKIRWRRVLCPICGDRITNNALGKAAHIRHCTKEKAAARWAAERAKRSSLPRSHLKESNPMNIGTRVQLSTGTPRPKRGKWVIQAWLTENGQGTVSEIAPDYYVVRIDTRADGSQVMIQRSQVIHRTDTRFTVTPLEVLASDPRMTPADMMALHKIARGNP